MPYNRPGPGVYVTNGEDPVVHGAPVLVNNFAGVAVKQQGMSWAAGYYGPDGPGGTPAPAIIGANEPFFVITKGIVQVDNTDISSAEKGDAIGISEDGTLSTNGDAPFGTVVEVAGERGTPLNRVRIDLDLKGAAE